MPPDLEGSDEGLREGNVSRVGGVRNLEGRSEVTTRAAIQADMDVDMLKCGAATLGQIIVNSLCVGYEARSAE